VVLVQISLDVGKVPATVTSSCNSCGRSFALWVGLNGLRVRVVEAHPSLIATTSLEGIEYGIVLLDAFHRWCEVAISDRIPDHLKVLGAAGA
jgi:hypothetical protein